jgi:C1A family cysteine protease
METQTRKFGWISQQPDIRDKHLPLTLKAVPPLVDLRSKCPPVYDQLNLGSCTANAIAAAYEYEHTRQGLGLFMPSRRFIYYNERVIENSVESDSGATLRDGMKVIGNGDKGVGVCSEWRWPYIVEEFAVQPSDECYRVAKHDEALQYLSVLQNPMQLKSCLAAGFPFVFGFTVYSSFMNIGSDGIMTMPLPDDIVEGGHAVMCVGYDDSKQAYIIRNSWGADWGVKGYFYMPYNYMHNADLCDDYWTIRKVA